MTTTTTKTAAKKAPAKASTKTAARKAPAKASTPAKAIGNAAVDLEHDIAAALRQELKHLKKTIVTIQKDVRSALERVESAIEAGAGKKPSTKGRAARKPAPKKAAKAAPKKAAANGKVA